MIFDKNKLVIETNKVVTKVFRIPPKTSKIKKHQKIFQLFSSFLNT